MLRRLSFTFHLFLLLLLTTVSAARADVITDWNRIALPLVTSYSLAAPAYREMAMMHLAMYQCVNAVEPRHEPYKTRLAASPGTSTDVAAAVAAASVLSKLHPDIASKIDAELKQYVANIGAGAEAVSAGVALGENAAADIWQLRADDGSAAPDLYRPKTRPGQYVPTAPVSSSAWPGVTPFTLKSASQFRPGPPLELASQEWADNYNEIRQIGGKNSKTRSALQTETGRMWLYTGPGTFFPLAQQLSAAKGLDVHETARLFALLAMATSDAMVAVFDAKYRYEFWRPVTAIRNGDEDNNPKTEREADWEPLGATPMHPEYPCAHCIIAGTAGNVMKAFFGSGSLPEFKLSTPTAPGVTHSWTRLDEYIAEPSNARVWAGIHYRFSTVVGTDMGRKIAEHAVANYLRPLK